MVMISMPSVSKTASNARAYLLSRSLIRCLTVAPVEHLSREVGLLWRPYHRLRLRQGR